MILRALIRLLVVAIALLAIAEVVPGIVLTSFSTALIVAIVWGFVSLFIKPILSILTLPITFITLGLSSLLINALLFWSLAIVVPGFEVSGFVPACIGSVLLSLVMWLLHLIF